MASLTLTDIANFTLDACSGAMAIQNIDDEQNPDAVLLKRHLAHAVEVELEKHEWSFSRKTVQIKPINVDAKPELFIPGYTGFVLPTDFGRLSLEFFCETYPYRTNQYQTQHNYFLVGNSYLYVRMAATDEDGNLLPLTLPYCSNKVPIKQWPAIFCDVVALAAAVRVVGKIQGMDANYTVIETRYRDTKRLARNQQLIQSEAIATGYSDTQVAYAAYGGI